VTWFDLDAFHEGKRGRRDDWFSDNLAAIASKTTPPAPPALMQAASDDSMTRLMAFLRRPDPTLWRATAAAHATDFVLSSDKSGGGDATAKAGDRRKSHKDGPVRLEGVLVDADVRRGALDSARLELRIDDGVVARADGGYRDRWVRFLRLWNLFQWLPGLSVGVVGADGAQAAAPVAGAAEEAWIAELADRRLAPAIRAAVEEGIDLPEFGVDLVDRGGQVIGSAECLFRSLRVAVLLGAQATDRAAIEAEGFTTVLAEGPEGVFADGSALLRALRAAKGDEK
jgi:hypothetical protein